MILRNISVQKIRWQLTVKTMLDSRLIEQAVYGLISNATEASPQNGKIILALECQSARVGLSIEDQGSGISSELTRKGLFPGPTTKAQGSGLGIPFAYKVCDLHGGTLQFVKSGFGGTRVIISVPLRKSSEISCD